MIHICDNRLDLGSFSLRRFSQYVDFEGKPMDSKYNRIVSVHAIEGITSKNGQIINKMGHSKFSRTVLSEIKTSTCSHQLVKYFTGK